MDEEEFNDNEPVSLNMGDEDEFANEDEEDPMTMGFHMEDEPESDF